jgi:hypothetical protein
MPELIRFAEKHKNDPLVFIGVDAYEPESTVQDFVLEQGVTYPVALDRDGNLQKAFSIRSYPTTVLIGADGTVQLYEVGSISNADVAFDALLAPAFAAFDAGTGITREAFLDNARPAEGKTIPAGPEEESKKEEPALTGRAKAIGDRMNCPAAAHTLVNAPANRQGHQSKALPHARLDRQDRRSDDRPQPGVLHAMIISAENLSVQFSWSVQEKDQGLDSFSLTVERATSSRSGSQRRRQVHGHVLLPRPGAAGQRDISVLGMKPEPGSSCSATSRTSRRAPLPSVSHGRRGRDFTRLRGEEVAKHRVRKAIERVGLAEFRDLRLSKCSRA